MLVTFLNLRRKGEGKDNPFSRMNWDPRWKWTQTGCGRRSDAVGSALDAETALCSTERENSSPM